MPTTKVPNGLLTQPVNHNILINPSFTVKQRGDVIDHIGEATYGPDRWMVRGEGGVGGDKSRSRTDSSSGINKLVVEHDGAEGHSYATQYIEAVNLLGLYGKEMTFSFSYSDTGGSGVPIARIWSWDSSDNTKVLFEAIPTPLGNNRWTCTATLSTPDGTIPAPSERGMYVVVWPNEKNPAPNEWSVWETKLEVGSVATPFIARSYSEELDLCRRYYEKQVNYSASAVRSTLSGAGTAVNIFNKFYPKRAAPSVTFGTGVDGPKMEITPDVDKQTGMRLLYRSDTPLSAGSVLSLTYAVYLDSEL